jgi:hypothetical protein
MPDTTRPINRHPSGSSRDSIKAPVSMSLGLTTRHQWFTHVRLLGPHLPHPVRLFPRRSPPRLIHRSSSGRFDTCTCMPMSKDLPSSPQQHDNHAITLSTSLPRNHLQDTLMRSRRTCGRPSRPSCCTGPAPSLRPAPRPRPLCCATSTAGTTPAASKKDWAAWHPTSTRKHGTAKTPQLSSHLSRTHPDNQVSGKPGEPQAWPGRRLRVCRMPIWRSR